MRYFLVKPFLIGLFFLPSALLAQDNAWKLKKDEDGITVYTREVAGSNIKEFKASATINSPVDKIFDILLDVASYPAWIKDMENARALFRAGDSLGMYYQMAFPWPLKDRDLAMVSHINTNPDNSILLEIISAAYLVEEDDNFVRISDAKGQWLIKPLANNKTAVTYQFLADPGGFLPAWVINIFLVDGPFKTLQNLEVYAKELDR